MSIEGVRYDPEFKMAHFPVILEADDGTRFFFNKYILTSVSPFFEDLLKLDVITPPDNRESLVIPLLSATRPALSLALTLIRDQLDLPTHNVLPWPPREQLEGFLKVVDAYDMEVAGNALLTRTARSMGHNAEHVFERLAVAVAVKSPWLHNAELRTLSYDLDSIDEWTRNHLNNNGYSLEKLYSLHLRFNTQALSLQAKVVKTMLNSPANRQRVDIINIIENCLRFLDPLARVLFNPRKINSASEHHKHIVLYLRDLREEFRL